MIISLLDYKKKKRMKEDIGFFSQLYQANCTVDIHNFSNYFDKKIKGRKKRIFDAFKKAHSSLYNFLDSIYYYEGAFDIIYFEIDDKINLKNYDKDSDILSIDFSIKFDEEMDLNFEEKLKLREDGKAWTIENKGQKLNWFLANAYRIEDCYYEEKMLAFNGYEDFYFSVKDFNTHIIVHVKVGYNSSDLFNEDAYYLKGDIEGGFWMELKDNISIRSYTNSNEEKVYVEIHVICPDSSFYYKISYSSWEFLVNKYLSEEEINVHKDDFFSYTIFGEVIFEDVFDRKDLEIFFDLEGVDFTRQKEKYKKYYYTE